MQCTHSTDTPSGHHRERERWEKGRRAVLCWRWRLLPYAHGYICTYTVLAVLWESRGERRRDTSVIRGGSAADTEPTTPRPANSSAATPVARTHSGQARNTHTAQPPLCPPATATPSSPAAAARPGLDHLEPDCQRACAGQRPYGMSRPRGVLDHVRPGACAHSIA